MEKENLLRMAVKARKRYLIRMIMASDFYASYDSIEQLEKELNGLTLSELEEHWKSIKDTEVDLTGE